MKTKVDPKQRMGQALAGLQLEDLLPELHPPSLLIPLGEDKRCEFFGPCQPPSCHVFSTPPILLTFYPPHTLNIFTTSPYIPYTHHLTYLTPPYVSPPITSHAFPITSCTFLTLGHGCNDRNHVKAFPFTQRCKVHVIEGGYVSS